MSIPVEWIYKTQRGYLKMKKLSHIIVLYSMCPGKFYNKIKVINFFALNKSNDIDFVTFFLIQLH